MYGRISTYELPADSADEARRAFGEALAAISECPGFLDGFYLVSCEGERVQTLTLWGSRAHMESSRVTASRLRTEAAREADGGIVSTEEFEIHPVRFAAAAH